MKENGWKRKLRPSLEHSKRNRRTMMLWTERYKSFISKDSKETLSFMILKPRLLWIRWLKLRVILKSSLLKRLHLKLS